MNNKYLIEFNQTGISTVNVDLIAKDWSDKFVISQYSPPDKKPDIFRIHITKRNNNLKTLISKEQALEIINKCKLVEIKSSMFASGKAFYNMSYVESAYNKFIKRETELLDELAMIRGSKYIYENAIDKYLQKNK